MALSKYLCVCDFMCVYLFVHVRVCLAVCAYAICKDETEFCIDYRAVTSLLNDKQFLLDVS